MRKNRPELKYLERIYLVQDKIKFHLKKKTHTLWVCLDRTYFAETEN